jgi:hypothetical protein
MKTRGPKRKPPETPGSFSKAARIWKVASPIFTESPTFNCKRSSMAGETIAPLFASTDKSKGLPPSKMNSPASG